MSPTDPQSSPPAKRSLPDRPIVWELLLFVLIFVVVMVVGGAILAAVGDVAFGPKLGEALRRGLPDPNQPAEAWFYLVTFALFYLALTGAIMLAMLPHGARWTRALALVLATWKWFVFGTIAVVVLSQACDSLLLPFLRDVMAIGGDELQIVLLIRALTASFPLAIGAVIVLAVLAPLAEEFFFRGLLYGWLRGFAPFWLTALITSVLFGLAHGEIAHAVAAGILGLALAYIRERSGSLWPPIAAHVVNNMIAVATVPLGM